MLPYFFDLASMQKTMGRPIIDFQFSKWGCGTNDDDGDDEWITFQQCGDAKSQEQV